ncbi:cytochrome c oxidase subunit II [Picrophilus oshimae]|uniref:Cytochrome c oxidase polypeptide II n=1 Tax=Picrophilus torridus (strain ATCC 700027 / DSM 9790 / JCM 10055 / NBRC 100828 / KAW 2/3) TaxID=1122961 RepID=Q6KZG1_PICTO|nr:cytochrome-c oxidase [Picrophilus oshimae]AAT43891.1 cytochrome c oxidase polypeptide II [Picrophilus oshimae DSM 9789]SMD31037.1 cytochrome c oxidase subunit 2 [Picrophilus oshimae DSM 9789]
MSGLILGITPDVYHLIPKGSISGDLITSIFLAYILPGIVIGAGFAFWYIYVFIRNWDHIKKKPEEHEDDMRPGRIEAIERGNKTLFKVFVLFVVLILLSLMVYDLPPAYGVRVAGAAPSAPTDNHHYMYIDVIGYQWQWIFIYPNGSSTRHFAVLPADTPIQFNVTSVDVMHSFYLINVTKVDAFPGHYNFIWTNITTPGLYYFECVELCGLGHAHMRGPVAVIPLKQWEQWESKQKPGEMNQTFDFFGICQSYGGNRYDGGITPTPPSAGD